MKSSLTTSDFTQIRSQSTPNGQPSAATANYEKVLDFFGSKPSVLTADERYHTTSKSTRRPGQFDKHLHDRLRLKRVAKLPELLPDLLNNAIDALSSYKKVKDLPDHNALFTFAQAVERKSKKYRRDIHKEIDVQLAYGSGVADLCASVAATLEFQFSHWSPNCLQWSTARLSNRAIPGVRRDQALADGFLNMSDKGSQGHPAHPTPRERLILDVFPVIAIWEFKNLNFDTPEGQVDLGARAEVFSEMVDGFIGSVFPWEGCEKEGDCAIAHWKIGTSACPMGNNAVFSSCQSYDNARKMELPLPEKPCTGHECGLKHSARDILQQAWTEALVHDCTFLVINAGNVEVIGMRDRLTQTLYLSDVVFVGDPSYPYFQLHTGLYVSALRDAQDRAEAIVLRKEIPDTWHLQSGLDSDKIMDLSHQEFRIKKNVISKVLLEAGRRPWLIILPIERLPNEFHILHRTHASQEFEGNEPVSSHSQELQYWYWATNNSPSPRTEAWYSTLSSRHSTPLLSCHSTPSLSRHSTSSAIDEVVDVDPDVTSFFELHAEDSFHGLRICRAKIEIPGIIYPRNFKEADKPWTILKNASTTKDIFLLENESKVYDVLNEASDANFAALLLEDKGDSLAHLKTISPGMEFHVSRKEKLRKVPSAIEENT
ncbi:hypothetical protein J132_01620 [Termitomyces sp. J132]|nr:hypothetical protein J132_01620 [Termitomyces sp. J132]